MVSSLLRWSRNRTGENKASEPGPLEWTLSWALLLDAFVGYFMGAFLGVLEGLKTGKSTLAGPRVGRTSLSPARIEF